MTQTLDHLLTRQATLLHRIPAGEDDAGDFAYDTVATAVPIELQQAGSSEFADGGILQSRWRAWLPAAAATATGWDALELDGTVYELDGDPAVIWNPTTRSIHHVEAELVSTR